MYYFQLFMVVLDMLFFAYHIKQHEEICEWNTLFILFWGYFIIHDMEKVAHASI